jgi:hypothetical protein
VLFRGESENSFLEGRGEQKSISVRSVEDECPAYKTGQRCVQGRLFPFKKAKTAVSHGKRYFRAAIYFLQLLM